ncbi:hypothetical protein H7U28_04530 [Coprobacillus cateniformis]|nr:hypothetical protein [Coprobacillus cateniformis]
MKYKIGDKVRIIKKEAKEDALEEDIINSAWNQDMDKYLGKIMTIKGVTSILDCKIYNMEEDEKENYERGWAWTEEMIEELASVS